MQMFFYLKNDQFRQKRSHIHSFFQYLLFWIYTLSYPCDLVKATDFILIIFLKFKRSFYVHPDLDILFSQTLGEAIL